MRRKLHGSKETLSLSPILTIKHKSLGNDVIVSRDQY